MRNIGAVCLRGPEDHAGHVTRMWPAAQQTFPCYRLTSCTFTGPFIPSSITSRCQGLVFNWNVFLEALRVPGASSSISCCFRTTDPSSPVHERWQPTHGSAGVKCHIKLLLADLNIPQNTRAHTHRLCDKIHIRFHPFCSHKHP